MNSKALFLTTAALGTFSVGTLWADTSALIHPIRERLEYLEQVSVVGNIRKQIPFARRMKHKLVRTAGPLMPLFKQNGIELTDSHQFVTLDPSVDRWRERLKKMDSKQFCAAAELALAAGILAVDVIPPSQPIRNFMDVLVDERHPSPDVTRDRARALWTFRYINALPQHWFPKECLEVAKTAKIRTDYIFDRHKPLGAAIGMCARPMNAHYIEAEVEARRMQEPEGWGLERVPGAIENLLADVP